MSKTFFSSEDKNTFPLRLAIIFVLFSATIILLGVFYFNSQRKRIFREEEDNLAAIASMKIVQIESWRRERMGDAVVIGHNTPLIKSFAGLLSRYNREAETDIYEWMNSVKNEYDYKNVLIADTSFKVRLSVLGSDSVLSDSLRKELKANLKNHTPFLTDLHMSKENPYIHLDIFITLFDSINKKQKPIGVVILRIDPTKILFPLIKSWPTQSKSSETLLLRRAGDSVLYLNELRHAKNSALKLKLPLTNKDLLATKALNGLEGLAEGVDYRNIPVVGSLKKIPETSWYMLAKVDKEEVLLPLQRYVLLIIIVVVLLILVNASIFGLWIWKQRIKFYKNLLKSEISILELEDRFTTAFRMSPVSVTISSVSDNKFIDVNNAFLHDMEYTREEVIGRTAKELNIWADEGEREWIINEISEKGKISGKVISYKTRTGKILYGLSSMSVVSVKGEPCNLSSVVNITERKNSEEKLAESEELFRKLFENMLNGFAYCKMLYEEGHPADFLYLNVNDSFSVLTGLKDVVGKRASEAIPGIQESDPELLERYGRVAMSGQPEVFETWVESLKMWFAISVYSPQRGYFVAVFDVITSRKLAEEKLRETNEYLSNLFNYANAPIITWDKSLLIIRFNHAFEELSGYSEEEVIGKKIDLLFPKEKTESTLSLIKDAVSGERWETVEIEIKRKSGESRVVLWNSANIHDKDGKTVIATIAQGHDITKRKHIETELRESEMRFRQTFELSPIGIVMVGLDRKFLRCNDSFSKSLGFKMEELAGKTIADITYPEDISIGMNDMLAIAKGELETSHVQKRYFSKDGKIVWGDVLISLIRNSSDEPQYFLAIIQDITESKKIVEALRESEERFRSLYENVTIGIYRTTFDGQILMANPAMVRMLGFDSIDQLVQRNLQEEGFEPDYPRSKFLESLERDGIILGLESAWNQKNGNVLIVRESANAVKDSEGRIVYFDGTVEDITDRKKTEEALRESEDKFKYIFDHSVIGKSITLPSGEINVNQSFCDMLGYTRDELEKTRWQDISHPDDIELVENTLKSILSGKSDFARFIKRYIHKNGNIVWTDVGTALRRDEHRNPLYFLSSIMDITDRKNSEEMILQLNEELEQKVIHRTGLLEAANKELEAFSYSVSHDLRAPLRSVHSYTKILLEEYESRLDDEGKRICGIISSSATQMGELIDDLLSFSRIGRTSMNMSLLDMKSIVQSVFKDISTPDEKAKTTFKVGRLHKAFGDTNLLKLVWTNLISNAIKYSSKEIISEISVSSQLRYGRITYSVKDNGVGFDMNYKHKLFGVFQRLHSEAEFEGNGVGLAIVQRIVLKHGGKVWAEGEEGKGATFYFSLPVQD